MTRSVRFWVLASAVVAAGGCANDDGAAVGSGEQAATSSWTSADGSITADFDVPDTAIACGETGAVEVTLHGQGVLKGGDAVFVMDSSGSVGNTGWSQETGFVSNAINTQLGTIGNAPEDNRVGVVQFSGNALVRYHLAQPQNATTIANLVNTLPFLQGATATRSAILAALNLFTTESASERAKLIVLITDGIPYPTSENVCDNATIANQLAAAGVKVVVVAVGSFDATRIDCLVDDPTTDIVTVADFQSLGTLDLGTLLPLTTDVSFRATLAPSGDFVGTPAASSGTSGISVDGAGNPLVSWDLDQVASTETLSFEAALTDPALTGHGAGPVTLHLELTLSPEGGASELFELDQTVEFAGCDPCSPIGHDDSDGDGVADTCDLCAGYDDGIDSDGDGIPDGCDLCPFDPANDADGDGVCGDVDVCPGFDDHADADGDGAPDGCDVCPLDPANDADGDLLCAGDDNCPTVANPGQEDLDGDGLGDACDDDADGDGVLDDDDACLGSAVGSVVDADGCTIDQLCPCDGGWRNHGAYVVCVAHAANDFVAAGLISDADHDAIVSAAGASGCGH